jgi:RND family efflux transporter MFP subunit
MNVNAKLCIPYGQFRVTSQIGILATVLMLHGGCGKQHEKHPTAATELPVAQVQVQSARRTRQAATEEVVGTVRARLRATLEARVSGRIDKLPVLLGQEVRAGELVAHLDAAEIKARLDQAQAALEQADRDLKRVSALLAGQAVTKSEYDATESRQRVAKAAVAEAQVMMGYAEVVAPFAGVVTKKWADVGDLASPGKPLIEMEDPAALQIDADAPEAIASRIERGGRLAVRIGPVGAELSATVSEIAPSADPGSRTVRVKLDLPQTPGLKSGQFARLLVPVGEESCLRVPASAVVQRGQLEIVFVVANQHTRLRLVKTGKRTGEEVEILSGLDHGDSVVSSGAALLTDGQPVEVK